MDEHLDRLVRLIPPPDRPAEPPRPEHWTHIEQRLGTRLPADFRALVGTYGTGGFDEFLSIFNPAAGGGHRMDRAVDSLLEGTRHIGTFEPLPFPVHPQPGGLLPWGTTSNGDSLYWVTEPGHNPDRWQIAISEVRGPGWERHPGPVARFVAELFDHTFRVPFFPDDFPSTDARWTPFRSRHEPIDPRSWDRAERAAQHPRRSGELRAVLDGLVEAHVRIGSPLPSALRPGLSSESLAAALAPAGVTVRRELLELYGWRDGSVAPDGSDKPGNWVVPEHRLLPIEGALGLHASLAPILASRSGLARTHAWLAARDWLPIMQSESTVIGLICSGENAGELRSILEHRTGPGPDATTWTEIWTPYLELTSAIEDFVGRFRAGLYAWDSTNEAWIEDHEALEDYRESRF